MSEPNQFPKKNKVYLFVKRLFDILLSFTLLLLLSWAILLDALILFIVTLNNPFFVDERIGFHGNTINVFKFNTMVKDAESNIEKYLTDEQIHEWETERKIENDPRITKIGKVLRKTSIDELPQLINIFLGSLSFVGPRPITKNELIGHFSMKEATVLLSMKPGLTGNWAINGRSDVDFKSGKRQQLELDYITTASIWFDLLIIFKTIAVVFKFKEAK